MKVARAADRLRSAADRASAPASWTASRRRAGRRFERRRHTRGHDSGAGHRRSGYRRPRAPGRARSERCGRSGGPTSRRACRRPRRSPDNGSRRARLPGPRTARFLWCRAACRACALMVPVARVTSAAGWKAGSCRSPSLAADRRGHRRMADGRNWSSSAPASPPARRRAHADGTAVRPAPPGSTPRRRRGPYRKDQRAACSSYGP